MSPGPLTEPARHVPVLAREVLGHLRPAAGEVHVDGTFGAGGYTGAILAVAGTRVIAIDRDRTAITAGMNLVDEAAGRLTLVEDRFSALDAVARRLGHESVDGVVLDIGVSSMQLDTAERGFSFRADGPLDMRMGGDGPSAADVLARIEPRDLARVLSVLGEEKFAQPIARAIVEARATAPLRTTRDLVDVVAKVLHPRPGQIHPATRTFQALRILVNEELDELSRALRAAERILKPGGRLVVVSFHSLEDRIVKTFLNDRGRAPAVSRHQPDAAGPAPTFGILTSRAVTADDDEVSRNPRARSAKLRAAERTPVAARAEKDEQPTSRAPSLDDILAGR